MTTNDCSLQVYDPYEQPPVRNGSVGSSVSSAVSYVACIAIHTKRIVGQQWRSAWLRLNNVRVNELHLIVDVISAGNYTPQ